MADAASASATEKDFPDLHSLVVRLVSERVDAWRKKGRLDKRWFNYPTNGYITQQVLMRFMVMEKKLSPGTGFDDKVREDEEIRTQKTLFKLG